MPNHPVDAHVGSRVRMRRTLLGLSQQKLGNRLGLTFQQVQKYERGANRIGASRLFEISEILGVPVNFFFDEMPKKKMPDNIHRLNDEDNNKFEHQFIERRETLELLRSYYGITDPNVRKRVFEVVKSISNRDGEDSKNKRAAIR